VTFAEAPDRLNLLCSLLILRFVLLPPPNVGFPCSLFLGFSFPPVVLSESGHSLCRLSTGPPFTCLFLFLRPLVVTSLSNFNLLGRPSASPPPLSTRVCCSYKLFAFYSLHSPIHSIWPQHGLFDGLLLIVQFVVALRIPFCFPLFVP